MCVYYLPSSYPAVFQLQNSLLMNQSLNIYGDLINIEYINNIKLIDCIYYILSQSIRCHHYNEGWLLESPTLSLSWLYILFIHLLMFSHLYRCLPLACLSAHDFPLQCSFNKCVKLWLKYFTCLIIFHDQLFSLPASL